MLEPAPKKRGKRAKGPPKRAAAPAAAVRGKRAKVPARRSPAAAGAPSPAAAASPASSDVPAHSLLGSASPAASGFSAPASGLLSLGEFAGFLGNALDALGGRRALERGAGVRGNLAPDKRAGGSGGRAAHYGAVYPSLVAAILRAARLAPGETFADIGSGIGCAVLQAALTTSCASAVGVEVVRTRHDAAGTVKDALLSALPAGGARDRCLLRAELRLGDAFDDETADFLSTRDVLFVNNAMATMAPERVAIARAKPIDERLANVAKRLRVGGRLLAMDTVPLLDVAVEGGAFERTELASSRDAVSWTDAPVPLYLYTKVGDTWKCPRCTFANPLYDDFTFVTECALCPDELRAKFGLGAGDVDSHRPKRAAAARSKRGGA